MSLILEALKKSEAKRRLGAAPDLGTPFAARRRRSPIVPIVVVVLIVGAVVWWAMQRTPTAPAQNAATPTAPAPRANSTLHSVTGNNSLQQTPPPSNLAKPAAQDPFTPNARAMSDAAANGTQPALRDVLQRKRANLRDRADNPGANAMTATPHSAAAPAPNAPAAIATPNVPAATTARPIASAMPPPQPISKPAPPAVATAAAAPPPQQTAATPTTPDATTAAQVAARAPKTPGTIGLPVTPPPATQAAPTKPAPSVSAQPYSELPFSVRKSLPELKLSMHVYVADPAQRFVILNDSRISEGDKTNDDVYVREIRPDGVVLEFQGQRFFYPRDGL